MVSLGVIKRVHEPTDWVSSLVYSRKANGKIRICLDPKDLNLAIKRPHYATRTLDEVTHHLGGARVFSKLDARSGYWSVHLDQPSSLLTTFNSPFGRYRFLRLPFGLNLSQDVFQERMDRILEYCPGTIGIADDVGVFGKDEQQHDENLRHLMKTASQHGLVFNETKCSIKTDSLTFFGLHFDKDGVHPDPERVKSIQQMTSPDSPQALREFLGIATYMGPFTKDLAHHATPLRELLKKDVDYQWSPTYEKIFNNVKDRICAQTTLSYYDPKKKTTVQVDASGRGLGATLLQDDKPIAFASKTLSPAETRYANIEREMLAVVFGCERFHNYVFATRFIVQSDHKPLEMITRKNLFAAPTRLQRMLLRVQPYDFKLIYKPGKEMLIADALSRQPLDASEHIDIDIQISPVQFATQKIENLKLETSRDETLQALLHVIHNGWPSVYRDAPKDLRDYWPFRDELTTHDGLILKGPQVLVPPNSRRSILSTLHTPHMGIVKTCDLARSHVYWPGISKDITDMIQSCLKCREHANQQCKEPLLPYDTPTRPWQYLSSDLFYYNNITYLLICDYYTKFPFVYAMRAPITSANIIDRLKTLFAEHGIPDRLLSDNGGHYSSQAFRTFASEWGFDHVTSSPYHSQSNGLAERTVQSLKNILKKSENFQMSLLLLRSTPVIGSTRSPAELLYGRKLANPLPCNYPIDPSHENTLSSNVSTARHYDKNKFHRNLPDIEPLTNIHYRDHVSNTWKPAVVTSQRQEPRSYDIRTTDGTTLRRNRRDIRPTAPSTRRPEVVATHLDAPAYHRGSHVPSSTPSTLGPDVETPLRDVSPHTHLRDDPLPTSPLTPGPELDNHTLPTISLRRSNRITRPPARLIDS